MTPRKKQLIKTFATGIAIVVTAFGLFVAWSIIEIPDKKMIEKADSIPVPDSWELKEEKIVGHINLCLEKSGCPSLQREWMLPEMYSGQEIRAIFAEAGILLNFSDSDCLDENSDSGFGTICGARYKDENYQYAVYQSDGSSHLMSPYLSLSIRQAP